MRVLQCPRCPLRFDLAPMLADHLARDHDVAPSMTDALQPPAQRVGRRDAAGELTAPGAGPGDAGGGDAGPGGAGAEGSGT